MVFKDKYYSIYFLNASPYDTFTFHCEFCSKDFDRFVQIRAHVGRKHKGVCDNFKKPKSAKSGVWLAKNRADKKKLKNKETEDELSTWLSEMKID